jgi:hypothetical protein
VFLRPCFLVVDREFAGSISSRKLVIETAKFNVITAYSFEEAVATLEKFPSIDAVVANADGDEEAAEFFKGVRRTYPQMKLVLTGILPSDETPCDRCIPGFAPDKLLEGLRDLFPAEDATARQIERNLEEKARNC